MGTVEQKAAGTSGLEISCVLTSEGLSNARISLREHGIPGTVAFTVMQALADAVKDLEGSVATLKLTVDAESSPTARIRAEIQLEMPFKDRSKDLERLDEFLSRELSTFNDELDFRLIKRLSRRGIKTVSDLIAKTSDDLLSFRNFGELSLSKVRNFLQRYNLHLRDD